MNLKYPGMGLCHRETPKLGPASFWFPFGHHIRYRLMSGTWNLGLAQTQDSLSPRGRCKPTPWVSLRFTFWPRLRKLIATSQQPSSYSQGSPAFPDTKHKLQKCLDLPMFTSPSLSSEIQLHVWQTMVGNQTKKPRRLGLSVLRVPPFFRSVLYTVSPFWRGP